MAFLLIFFKNFVRKTRVTFFNKENVMVVEITGTWSPDIPQNYKLVKARRRSVSNSTENLRMLLTTPLSESKVKP